MTMTMSMNDMTMGAQQHSCSEAHHTADMSEPADASSMAQAQCSDMSDMVDCNAEHCVTGSAIMVSAFNITFSNSASSLVSVDISADSIDAYPPYHPPISH